MKVNIITFLYLFYKSKQDRMTEKTDQIQKKYNLTNRLQNLSTKQIWTQEHVLIQTRIHITHMHARTYSPLSCTHTQWHTRAQTNCRKHMHMYMYKYVGACITLTHKQNTSTKSSVFIRGVECVHLSMNKCTRDCIVSTCYNA